MFPSRVEVLLTTAVCEQTLRYGSDELSAQKGAKQEMREYTFQVDMNCFRRSTYFFYIYIDDIWVYIYVNPESLGPLKRIDMFLGFCYVWKEHAKSACVCVFFSEKKCIYKKLSLRPPGCIWNLLVQTSFFRQNTYQAGQTCPRKQTAPKLEVWVDVFRTISKLVPFLCSMLVF